MNTSAPVPPVDRAPSRPASVERAFRARGGFTMLTFAAVALLAAIGSFALIGAVERNVAPAVV